MVCLSSCATPDDRSGAIQQATQQSYIRFVDKPDAMGGKAVQLGIGTMSETTAVISKTPCEGALGSLVAPMAHQCLTQPWRKAMDNLMEKLDPGYDRRPDPNEQTAFIAGVEAHWVAQAEPNDCWAAALQTTRAFLKLPFMSQNEIIDRAQRLCPKLRDQEAGADAYQIAYATAGIFKDELRRRHPDFCTDEQCLIDALRKKQPVIVYGSGHAFVLVGMDYRVFPNPRGRPLIRVKRLFILDPLKEKNGRIEQWPIDDFCKADAFFVY